jgi:hypothetical protein
MPDRGLTHNPACNPGFCSVAVVARDSLDPTARWTTKPAVDAVALAQAGGMWKPSSAGWLVRLKHQTASAERH